MVVVVALCPWGPEEEEEEEEDEDKEEEEVF